MLGAIIGDSVDSVYEWQNVHSGAAIRVWPAGGVAEAPFGISGEIGRKASDCRQDDMREVLLLSARA